MERRRTAIPKHVVPWQAGAVVRWLAATDHKQVGILTIVTSLVFLLLDVPLSLLVRTQLAVPNNGAVTRGAFNQLVTMHGATLLFLVGLPLVLGLATYLTPLMIGARDMALPRVTALSYWLYAFAGILLYSSWLARGGAPKATFESLVPLAEGDFSTGLGQTLLCFALILLAVAWLVWGINTLLTVAKYRAEGMTWQRLPVFAWAATVSAAVLVVAAPILGVANALLVLDREAGTHVFVGGEGARAYEHLFWAFGQPAFGVIALLAVGAVSEVIPVFSGRALAARRPLLLAIAAMGALSILAYGRNLATSGHATWVQSVFMIAALALAAASAVAVIAWLATLWGGRVRFSAALLFAVSFILVFSAGVLTSVYLAAFPVSWQLQDTAWWSAQLEYVTLGSVLFGVFAGLFFWWPKMFGRVLDERLGVLSALLLFAGFNATFVPQFLLGLLGLQRDAYVYSDPAWAGYEQFSLAGAILLAAGLVVLAVNVLRTAFSGVRVGRDPWSADTLEWYAESPPIPHNFAALPVIESERPVYDARCRLEARGR